MTHALLLLILLLPMLFPSGGPVTTAGGGVPTSEGVEAGAATVAVRTSVVPLRHDGWQLGVACADTHARGIWSAPSRPCRYSGE